MRRTLAGILAGWATLGLAGMAAAASPSAAADLLRHALTTARPGETISLPAGEWRDVVMELKLNGAPDAPITITAEVPGGTRFTGRSRVKLLGSHLVLSGLVFADGDSEDAPVITIRGENNRLTDTAILRFNPPDPATRYPWVQVHGRGHRVDRCRFEGQNHSGVTLQVMVGAGDNRLRIDHNHFLHRAPGQGNGFESLQLGQSQDSPNPSRSLVEHNLFEACDGEAEIVSNKSCENTYWANTFLRCAGTLTLRHGDRCIVEDNAFLGEGKKGAGGIRVIGRDHLVRRNRLEGVSAFDGGVVAIYAGIPDGPLNGYFAADRARVEQNFFSDTQGGCFMLGAGFGTRDRSVLPGEVCLQGNWVVVDERSQDSKAAMVKWAGPGPLDARISGNLIGSARLPSPSSDLPAVNEEGFRVSPAPLLRERLLGEVLPLSARDVGPTWWSH